MNLLRLIVHSRRTLVKTASHGADSRVPLRLKLSVLGVAILIISPLNILGDIPLLGILDDAALLTLLMMWFVRASTPYVAGPVIDREPRTPSRPASLGLPGTSGR